MRRVDAPAFALSPLMVRALVGSCNYMFYRYFRRSGSRIPATPTFLPCVDRRTGYRLRRLQVTARDER